MSSIYLAKRAQLSLAWAEIFLGLMRPGITKLSPVVVTITQFDDQSLPLEDLRIRKALDKFLKGKQLCRTVANTIFPNSLWHPSVGNDAQDLYARYSRVWPRVKRCKTNSNGVYFRRLTAYLPKIADEGAIPINQLDHVIKAYKRGTHRHSALQASIFDPTRDHSFSYQRGFPCLQQVAFGVLDGGLELTGFYALQHHIAKSYGNYLGLCWLGRFMAKQFGLPLRQVTCVASVLKLGDSTMTKTKLSGLKSEIEDVISETVEQQL